MKHDILDDYEYFVNNWHDLAEKLSRIEEEFKLKAKREHRHGHYLEGDKYVREMVDAEFAAKEIKLIAIYSKDELNREAAP